jgi:GNAT superfamily N-acetyltransferase
MADKEEFDPIFKDIGLKICADINYIEIEPVLTRVQTRKTKNSPWIENFCLVAYDKGKPIGYSHSVHINRYSIHMRNSGVLPRYRRKGIYSKMLRLLTERAIKNGYIQVHSHHHPTNTAILIAKLKAGFMVSGLDVGPDSGSLVRLTKFLNQKVEKLYRYRVGETKLDKKLAKELKTNPLR